MKFIYLKSCPKTGAKKDKLLALGNLEFSVSPSGDCRYIFKLIIPYYYTFFSISSSYCELPGV